MYVLENDRIWERIEERAGPCELFMLLCAIAAKLYLGRASEG